MADIFEIKKEKSKNKKIAKFYEKAMKELIDFYGVNWTENRPKVILADSRKTFETLVGRETRDWVVGTVLKPNTVVLLSPENFEKESNHKYVEEEYFSLLKHELSHLFFDIFVKEKSPVWLEEGFALYTAGQLVRQERPKVFEDFLNYSSFSDGNVYRECGFVVEILIKEFGKERVLEFLRVFSKESFKKDFEKFFKIKLGYEFFNNYLLTL